MFGSESADTGPPRSASLTASWMLNCTVVFSETTLVPFINKTLPDHRFMQDNDPKHTSRRAQAFLEEKRINWWRTPPESPDLNPIEDLWHELKFYLETKVKPTNKEEQRP